MALFCQALILQGTCWHPEPVVSPWVPPSQNQGPEVTPSSMVIVLFVVPELICTVDLQTRARRINWESIGLVRKKLPCAQQEVVGLWGVKCKPFHHIVPWACCAHIHTYPTFYRRSEELFCPEMLSSPTAVVACGMVNSLYNTWLKADAEVLNKDLFSSGSVSCTATLTGWGMYIASIKCVLVMFLPARSSHRTPCFRQSWSPPLCVQSILIPEAKQRCEIFGAHFWL